MLFGFDVEDKDVLGYLAIGPDGPSVVEDRDRAARFALSAEPGKGTPKDWCEFFKTEPQLSGWRFHPVVLLDQGEKAVSSCA